MEWILTIYLIFLSQGGIFRDQLFNLQPQAPVIVVVNEERSPNSTTINPNGKITRTNINRRK